MIIGGRDRILNSVWLKVLPMQVVLSQFEFVTATGTYEKVSRRIFSPFLNFLFGYRLSPSGGSSAPAEDQVTQSLAGISYSR